MSYSHVVWIWHQRSNSNMNGRQQIVVAWLLDHTRCYVLKIKFSRIYFLPLEFLRILMKIPAMISFPVVWLSYNDHSWLVMTRNSAPGSLVRYLLPHFEVDNSNLWRFEPFGVSRHEWCDMLLAFPWPIELRPSKDRSEAWLRSLATQFSYWIFECWVSRRVEVMHHRSCIKL